jgi:hypothetical protein
MKFRIPLVLLLFAIASEAVCALDHISLDQDGKSVRLSGRVLTEAQDGGLLVQDREGVLFAVQPRQLVGRTRDDTPFSFLPVEELQARLLEQLPAGFRAHTTVHYLICYNTSPVYAKWCGALYERLFQAFYNYWERRGLKLKEPELPLVALIFADQASYEGYARTELGDAAASVVGFYSLRTNRVTMFDLTGTKGLQGAARRFTSAAQINGLLMRPEAERLVATIIHEATHQIAYNCAVHMRYADIPLWVSEGLAVFFETPDLRSSQGWRNIGGVSLSRLAQFRHYLPTRPPESLQSLVQDDTRFRQAGTALDAYAEAWALHHFLITTRLNDYVRYLQKLSEKPLMIYDTPEERLAEFRRAFGDDLSALDADFLRYVSGLR